MRLAVGDVIHEHKKNLDYHTYLSIYYQYFLNILANKPGHINTSTQKNSLNETIIKAPKTKVERWIYKKIIAIIR